MRRFSSQLNSTWFSNVKNQIKNEVIGLITLDLALLDHRNISDFSLFTGSSIYRIFKTMIHDFFSKYNVVTAYLTTDKNVNMSFESLKISF